MTDQRLEEWEVLDERAIAYHVTQWESPKEMTKQFESFIAARLQGSKSVTDLGCGAGGGTAYLARLHGGTQFLGLDLSNDLVHIARTLQGRSGLANLQFETADWYKLPESKAPPDGVVSMQTLSWLPNAEEPLERIFRKLAPRWCAVSSLFFEGDISCSVEVTEHRRSRTSFYNCYSIPHIRRIAEMNNFTLASYLPFEMPCDLERPMDIDFMGTYTLRVEGEHDRLRRMQVSGPLLMNWYFLLFERSDANSPN